MGRIIIDILKKELSEYQIEEVLDSEEEKINNELSSFESFKPYSLVVLTETVRLIKNKNKSFLSLLCITYTFKNMRIPLHESGFSEYEIIGTTVLQKNYGRVLMRHETIADTISELFEHTEIDFDTDKEFSRKYYVIASDEELLRKNITSDFLKTVKKFNGLEIEIKEKRLLVRLRKQFTVENGKIIADFIAEINNGEN